MYSTLVIKPKDMFEDFVLRTSYRNFEGLEIFHNTIVNKQQFELFLTGMSRGGLVKLIRNMHTGGSVTSIFYKKSYINFPYNMAYMKDRSNLLKRSLLDTPKWTLLLLLVNYTNTLHAEMEMSQTNDLHICSLAPAPFSVYSRLKFVLVLCNRGSPVGAWVELAGNSPVLGGAAATIWGRTGPMVGTGGEFGSPVAANINRKQPSQEMYCNYRKKRLVVITSTRS